VAEYGSNYAYGMSPGYKDDAVVILLVSKVEPGTEELTPKTFPVLDVVPSEYEFGYTGLNFIPKKYLWDFGDGTTSDQPKPRHTYSTYGFHRVYLTLMNVSGETMVASQLYDHSIALGKVDFSGEPLRGDKPLNVSFEDSSIAPTGCQYTGLQWDFGDTHGSTGQTTSNNYLDYGSYAVEVNATLDTI
jgi:PKD repeat protein